MKFQTADHRHEKELRDLCRRSTMPGWIRLAFAREPDFFHGLGVQGKRNEVLLATEGSRVVGMGCRSIRPAWVNGQRAEIGYLSGLRLLPEARGTGALSRGYAALKALHDAAPAPAYLTTVIASNADAATLLTSGRAGLPHYLDRGRYFTYAISLNRRRRRGAPGQLAILRAGEVPLESVTAFLNRCGSRRQFFPAIDAADFGTGCLRGLRAGDLRVAVQANDEIVGVAGVWNQSSFKQTIVTGYAAPIRLLRPAINAALRLAGRRPMPGPGESLDLRYLALCCVRNNDLATARALLEQICADEREGGAPLLVIGFHERDPLRAAMAGFLSFRYTSRLYYVCWDDGLDFVRGLDPARVPHLEAATL